VAAIDRTASTLAPVALNLDGDRLILSLVAT
jgi:hypothetical protein